MWVSYIGSQISTIVYPKETAISIYHPYYIGWALSFPINVCVTTIRTESFAVRWPHWSSTLESRKWCKAFNFFHQNTHRSGLSPFSSSCGCSYPISLHFSNLPKFYPNLEGDIRSFSNWLELDGEEFRSFFIVKYQ